MENSAKALQSYRKFLETIPLDKYRDELKDVKWVEQDLWPELLPQDSIFRLYWDRQEFLDFESWFEQFWQDLQTDPLKSAALKKFKAYHFNKHNDGWFKLGFKARMFRTWTAVLTQLDFCYMFAYVCAKQGKKVALECNAQLDISGIDLRVGNIDFEVGKITQRKEARSAAVARKNRIRIPYAVFNLDEYERKSHSPRVSPSSRMAYRNALRAFQKYFIVLNNGFVVFSEHYIEPVVRELGNPDKLKVTVEGLLQELSGE